MEHLAWRDGSRNPNTLDFLEIRFAALWVSRRYRLSPPVAALIVEGAGLGGQSR